MANRGLGWDSLLRLVVTVTECGVKPMFASLFLFFSVVFVIIFGDDEGKTWEN